MISVIDKIFGKFKIVFEKLTVGYNKTNKNITINNNSTNINYVTHIHLPSEDCQLSDEVLEKIKEETMINFNNACKEKPEEMEKSLKKYNLSALSVAGSTVTANNLMPWLYGATTVEPLMPMPSGDFIEKLPEAINQSVSGDTIGITEKVNVEIKDGNNKTCEDNDKT